MSRIRFVVLITLLAAVSVCAAPHRKQDLIRLTERVGREWSDELVHWELEFVRGEYPTRRVRLVSADGTGQAVQLTDLKTYPDGSLRSASVWTVVTLAPHQNREWRLIPGTSGAKTDLTVRQKDGRLEVTTSETGARFNLGEATFDEPVPAEEVPPYLAAIRLRSGRWGGQGWFETPHRCRSYRVWVEERGPVFVRVGFRYEFDGYRGEGRDAYEGSVRIAARQELIGIEEEFSLGDPDTYRIWKPESRADAIMWDWWQWRPHEAESNFCFSIYGGLRPTKARWFGHNSSVPEKRTGRNPTNDFETDYRIDYGKNNFDISINAYLRGLTDQAKSYMTWRAGDADSDAVGIVGLRAVDWLNPDMVPHKSEAITHHTDTSDLRIYSLEEPDLVVKAPLHLGRRVWGILTLQMPEAGPTEDVEKDGKVVKHAFQRGPSRALRLQSKYGNRPLDKVKDWALAWESAKEYPSLFVRDGGLQKVLGRIRSSRTLRRRARRLRHKPVMRYILDRSEKHAQAAYANLIGQCEKRIDILFDHGYCSHRGTNNNQYPWWMQSVSAQFDLAMGMPELSGEQKDKLRSYYAFCVHMLQDDEFMPPRTTGVGWGSANMPINTRGGRAVTASAISDNPNAAGWIERAKEYIDALVPRIWAEDGSPVSGPHYVSTQADPLINMVLPLYYAGEMPPVQKKYPRIRRFARHLIDRPTPPDRRVGHTRILPTIGHTRLEHPRNIGKYAVLMGLTDPKLAGEAYWMWKRAGQATSGFMEGVYYMHERFDERQPDLGSVVYPGSLTFLRNGFPRENETYMAIHAGNHGFDHYDRDVGGFLLYAKGAPLMMDFSSMYTPNCRHSLWHNTVSWNVEELDPKTPCPGRGKEGCWFTGRTWKDHRYKPHTMLDRTADSRSDAEDPYKEYGGEMALHAFSDEVDYVRAEIPLREFQKTPFYNKAESANPVPWAPYEQFESVRLEETHEWQRRFVFIKDTDLQGPNYFVVSDDFGGQDELRPMANFWCMADRQTVDGNLVRWEGQYEVDLDMYVAFPKEAQVQRREWWHKASQPTRVKWPHEKGEYQIAAHVENQPGAGGFSVVLYPRRGYEVRPTYGSNADGSAMRVEIGERTDVIFCARQRANRSFGGVSSKGTVAVAKMHPDYTALVLCEAGSLEAREMRMESEGPLSIRVTGKTLQGRAAEGGDVTLDLGGDWAGRPLMVGGKKMAQFDRNGALTIGLAEGAQLSATR